MASTEGCLRCHSVDGSAHLGPTWAGLYESRVRLQTGEEVVADVGYLTESMMDPQAKLHAGYPSVMPSYFGKLRAEDTAALVSSSGRYATSLVRETSIPARWATPGGGAMTQAAPQTTAERSLPADYLRADAGIPLGCSPPITSASA